MEDGIQYTLWVKPRGTDSSLQRALKKLRDFASS